jgi:Spy/CpxP family protein refolding chaperone
MIRPYASRAALFLGLAVSVAPFGVGAGEGVQQPSEGFGGPPRARAGVHIPGIDAAALTRLQLNAEQTAKVTAIERDLQRKQLKAIGTIREARWKQQDALKAAEVDHAAVMRLHDEIASLRREYFEAALDARKRLDALLTPEQRLELSRSTALVPPGTSRQRAAPPASR